MTLLRVAFLAVAAAMISLAVRSAKPEMALVAGLAAGIAVMLMTLDDMQSVARLFTTLSEKATVSDENSKILLKSAGLSLIAEGAAQVCRDAGEGSLAQRVELAARCAMIVLAAPVILRLIDQLAVLAA